MSYPIEERSVLEGDGYEYLAHIVVDEAASEPDWLTYKTYAPDLRHWKDDGAPNVYVSDQPDELLEIMEEYGEWNDMRMYRFAKLFRAADPNGVYLVATYTEDRYVGDALFIYHANDEEREQGNVLVYKTSADIDAEWGGLEESPEYATRRDNGIQSTKTEVKSWNAWANGEVYGWKLYRHELDEGGVTTHREEVDACWGYYGQGEWSYMFECAKEAAEEHQKAQIDQRNHFMAAESGMALLAV